MSLRTSRYGDFYEHNWKCDDDRGCVAEGMESRLRSTEKRSEVAVYGIEKVSNM